jgi:hypothetical protein
MHFTISADAADSKRLDRRTDSLEDLFELSKRRDSQPTGECLLKQLTL